MSICGLRINAVIIANFRSIPFLFFGLFFRHIDKSRARHVSNNSNSNCCNRKPKSRPIDSFSQESHPSTISPSLYSRFFNRQLSPADLAYQESLIHEREQEIREIETGIHELNEIFRDLGTLVVEQGSMIGEWDFCLLQSALCLVGTPRSGKEWAEGGD